MNKFNIGDILRAKEDIQLSAWSDSKCLQGQCMQIAQVEIKVHHSRDTKIEYQLCFPDKAPYFRMSCSEQGLINLFELVENRPIIYCVEWNRN